MSISLNYFNSIYEADGRYTKEVNGRKQGRGRFYGYLFKQLNRDIVKTTKRWVA